MRDALRRFIEVHQPDLQHAACALLAIFTYVMTLFAVPLVWTVLSSAYHFGRADLEAHAWEQRHYPAVMGYLTMHECSREFDGEGYYECRVMVETDYGDIFEKVVWCRAGHCIWEWEDE